MASGAYPDQRLLNQILESELPTASTKLAARLSSRSLPYVGNGVAARLTRTHAAYFIEDIEGITGTATSSNSRTEFSGRVTPTTWARGVWESCGVVRVVRVAGHLPEELLGEFYQVRLA